MAASNLIEAPQKFAYSPLGLGLGSCEVQKEHVGCFLDLGKSVTGRPSALTVASSGDLSS